MWRGQRSVLLTLNLYFITQSQDKLTSQNIKTFRFNYPIFFQFKVYLNDISSNCRTINRAKLDTDAF